MLGSACCEHEAHSSEPDPFETQPSWRSFPSDEDGYRAAIERAVGDAPQQQMANAARAPAAHYKQLRSLATVASRSRSGSPLVITVPVCQPARSSWAAARLSSRMATVPRRAFVRLTSRATALPPVRLVAGLPKGIVLSTEDARFVTEFIDSLFPVNVICRSPSCRPTHRGC